MPQPEHLRSIERQRRSNTPPWLRSFALDVYGEQCIRCHAARPLEVAHLHGWEGVRRAVHDITADPDHPLYLEPDDVAVLFHQPINVVVLCPNCHTLYDEPLYTDVTTQHIYKLRDVELSTERAALAVRNWFCRGYIGLVGSYRRPNSISRWMHLLGWLKDAYERGLLPPPHIFLLSPTEMVDVTQALITTQSGLDQTLPRWNGEGIEP